MTEVLQERFSRSEMPGGYDKFHDRSRSRGEVLEPRGERYGRRATDINIKDERGVRREDKQEGGSMKDMHGGRHGGGGYGGDRFDRHEGGGGGGYRDRGAGGGRGFEDRGGQRGGRGGAAFGGGGGFGGGSSVAIIQPGQTSMLQSNHFRFSAKNADGKIYIYKAEFSMDNREAKFQALKSIDAKLT
jgi:hypothetical protein